MSDEELEEKLGESRQELFRIRFQSATGGLESSARLHGSPLRFGEYSLPDTNLTDASYPSDAAPSRVDGRQPSRHHRAA